MVHPNKKSFDKGFRVFLFGNKYCLVKRVSKKKKAFFYCILNIFTIALSIFFFQIISSKLFSTLSI